MSHSHTQYYLSTLLDFLLPRRCLSCGKSKTYLCTACCAKIPRAEKIINPELEAVFHYSDPLISRAIHLLKYRGGHAIALDLGRELNNYWQKPANTNRNQTWLVIPAPLSAQRRKKRGYNQSEKLARVLVEQNRGTLTLTENVLQKTRHTTSQVETKTRAARMENLRGAFTVTKPELIRNKNVLLIDDVITSGATLEECRRVLLEAGAARVRGLAVAHG
jgi:ComF family protein